MKILIISPFNFFPPYWGAAIRNYNLAKILARNNKIWIICNNETIDKNYTQTAEFKELSDNPNIQMFFAKYTGRGSQVFNPNVLQAALRIVKKENPDIIVSFSLWSAPQSIILKLLKNIPFILDEHNVEYLRFERMKRGNKISRKVIKLIEKISCRLASKIICVSKIDKDFLINELKIDKSKFEIIPNGIDSSKFYPNPDSSNRIRNELKLSNKPIITFFGTFDYFPNQEAANIIANDIVPRVVKKIPEAVFLMVGKDPPKKINHSNIIFTGMVDKIEDFINASDVIICPIVSGGGTRFKIIESLACGRIVISTSIGAEGLDIKEIDNIIICDNWDEFANQTVYALSKNPSKIKPEFINKYKWDAFFDNLDAVVKEVR